MSTSDSENWVEIAEVVRPHGVNGELRVKLYNADSEVLFDLTRVHVRSPDGRTSERGIIGVRPAVAGVVLLSLMGIEDRDGAEAARGSVLLVPREKLPALDEGEFYICDVVGSRVELTDGSEVGTVTGFRSYPSTEVLVIAGNSKQYEVPLVDDFVQSVDVQGRRVVLYSIDDLEIT